MTVFLLINCELLWKTFYISAQLIHTYYPQVSVDLKTFNVDLKTFNVDLKTNVDNFMAKNRPFLVIK